MAWVLALLGAGVAASGCADDEEADPVGDEDVGTDAQAIGGATSVGLPPGVARIDLDGGSCTAAANSDSYCFGTLISNNTIVTSAHCFRYKSPTAFTGSAFGQTFTAQNVRFHPSAWPDLHHRNGLD